MLQKTDLGGARLSCLDVAKGIGIICVVIGHLIPFCPLHYWIYGFHVPLFFLISGILCNYSKYDFRSFFTKRTRSLFVPFLFWYVLQMIIVEISRGDGLSFYRSVWFVLILYLVELLYYYPQKILRGSEYVILPIALVLAFCLQKFNVHFHFRFESIPAAMFFFGFGHYFKSHILTILDAISNWRINVRIFILVILFGLSLIRILYEPKMAIASNSLAAQDYFIAMCGVGLVLMVSRLINRSQFLQYLGRNTLVILGVHIILIVVSVDYVEPLVSNHWLFKFIQQIIIWGISILTIEIVNKYLPWVAGKPSIKTR